MLDIRSSEDASCGARARIKAVKDFDIISAIASYIGLGIYISISVHSHIFRKYQVRALQSFPKTSRGGLLFVGCRRVTMC